MSYLRNVALFCMFSLIITGCGGGNTTITSNPATDNTSGGSGGSTPPSNGGTNPAPSTGSVTLQWVAPTTRADNTSISLSEISSYRLYYGNSGTNTPDFISINDSTATQYTVTLPSGTYYFRISAVDSNGYEGLLSNAIQKTF